MNFHTAGPITVQIRQDTRTMEFTCRDVKIDTAQDPLDVTFYGKREYIAGPVTFRVEGAFAPESTQPAWQDATLTDEQRLAHAVLKGAHDAALALADEVQLRHSPGGRYVSRDNLVALLKRALDWLPRPADTTEDYGDLLRIDELCGNIRTALEKLNA